MEIVGCCRILAEQAVEGMDWSFERALDHAFYTQRVYVWEAAKDFPPASEDTAGHDDMVDQPSPEPVEATGQGGTESQGHRSAAWILSSGGRGRPAWMSDSDTESEEFEGAGCLATLKFHALTKGPAHFRLQAHPGLSWFL